MAKTELKRLARYIAGDFLQELVEGDALEVGLELRQLDLSDEEIVVLSQAI